jgi:hypothetical protein
MSAIAIRSLQVEVDSFAAGGGADSFEGESVSG